jgi:hypothetical protein
MMASIKEATENAVAFAKATLGQERTTGIRLEEVESGSMFGEDAWLITLSMIGADEPFNELTSAFGKGKREYKSFTVRKRDGEVLSMKIRELADA